MAKLDRLAISEHRMSTNSTLNSRTGVPGNHIGALLGLRSAVRSFENFNE